MLRNFTLIVGLVVSLATISAQTPPDNEIWYTTHNGEAPDFFEKNNLSSLLSYKNGMGVIKFDDSVDIDYIINYAFRYQHNLKSITLGNGVKRIPRYTFSGCDGLESVTIPNSVTEIEKELFKGCCNLNNITISNSVTEIGESTFDGCTSLQSITIPNGVAKIGDFAFRNCSSLTSIIIPDGVTEIGYGAFAGCTSLQSTTIPSSTTMIGYRAFAGCTGELIINCNIPDGVYQYPRRWYYPFQDSQFSKVVIGEGVTKIGYFAFRNCSSLTSITIPDSVTEIRYHAFGGCTSLQKITIPSGMIEEEAFYNCNKLTSVTLGSGVRLIKKGAFDRCTSLDRVIVSSLGGYDYFYNKYGIEVILNSEYISQDGRCLIVDGELTFCNLAGLLKYDIPEGVTKIGYHPFFVPFQGTIQSINIPESVTEIYGNAFGYLWPKQAAINVANSQCYYILKKKGISVSAFTGANASADGRCLIVNGELSIYISDDATEYVVPQNVEKINDAVFANCTDLTNVTVPDSVTTIGDHQFSGCNTLASITILATTPPEISDLSISETTMIYVPQGAIKGYIKDQNWKKYKKQIKTLN